MRKNIWLATLVCLNLALLVGILGHAVAPRTAFAQTVPGLSGNYLAVTGEVRDEFDVVYLLDVPARALHVIFFDNATKRMRYADSRNLERDFRNN